MSLVIEAKGSGRALGRAHGEAAKARIAAALEFWAEASLAASSEISAIGYARGLLGRTKLLETLGRLTPDLHEEIEGIAEAAGQPFELIAAYNLMDEQWWYDLGAAAVEPGCSLIGIARPGGTLLCQNMDLPKYMDGSQVILKLVPEDQPEQIILSSAGLIGLTGANAAGLGICVNTLLMLNPDATGLPVAAVFRNALAQRGRAGAAAVLRAVPHASGQHYAVADPGGIVSFECSAGACAELPISGGVLRHANHPLASDDINPRQDAILQERGRVEDSRERLAHLEGLDPSGADAGRLMDWLDAPDTPICVSPGPGRPGFTFGSVVFELSDGPVAHIRPGFPGEAGWQRLTFH